MLTPYVDLPIVDLDIKKLLIIFNGNLALSLFSLFGKSETLFGKEMDFVRCHVTSLQIFFSKTVTTQLNT